IFTFPGVYGALERPKACSEPGSTFGPRGYGYSKPFSTRGHRGSQGNLTIDLSSDPLPPWFGYSDCFVPEPIDCELQHASLLTPRGGDLDAARSLNSTD